MSARSGTGPSPLEQFERVLQTHAGALDARDPDALEQSNRELALALARLREQLQQLQIERRQAPAGSGAAAPVPAATLERMRHRLAAHRLMLMRALAMNRGALSAIGVTAQREPGSGTAAMRPAYPQA